MLDDAAASAKDIKMKSVARTNKLRSFLAKDYAEASDEEKEVAHTTGMFRDPAGMIKK